MKILYIRKIHTKIGEMILVSTQWGLSRLALPGKPVQEFLDEIKATYKDYYIWNELKKGERSFVNRKAQEQLNLYFDKKLFDFFIPLDLRGTDFQKKVWRELSKIPYGLMTTYKEIARAIEKPRAYRAVGAANNKNPVPIIVPCHRVIASDGSISGYSGGVELKTFLLAFEAAEPSPYTK